MKKCICVLVLLFVSLIHSEAQDTWDKYIQYDSTGMTFWGHNLFTIHQTLDKGFIVAGSEGYSVNSRIYLWTKLDSLGNHIWTNLTSDGHNSNIWSIAEDQDSNIYLCGTSYHFPSDLPIPMIFKSDKSGNVLWQKSLFGNNITAAHCIVTTFEGGTIVLANSSINPVPWVYKDIILVKLDDAGNVQWSKSYGGIDREIGYSVIQTTDSGYMVCGFSQSFGNYGMLILRTDSMGDLQWSKVFSGIDFNEAVSVIQTSDLNFIATGYDVTYSNGGYGSGILKLNSTGDTIWTKSLGNGDTLGLTTVIESPDHNLIFMGLKGHSGNQIIKADSIGQPVWNVRVDHPYYLAHSHLGEQTADGGYIIIGGNSYGGMSKLDTNGFNSCNSTQILPAISYPSVQVLNPTLTVTSDTILSGSHIYNGGGPEDTIQFTNCSSVWVLEKDKLSLSMNIFPNPAANQFAVSSSQFASGELEIFNILGENIYSDDFSGQMTIDARQFTKGIYFIRLVGSDLKLTQRLIIE